uniref:Uncharacterized protein n=1 Tax=Quercus lobata TaxID=97700 RepID=A0A7N2LBU1_QUELO
MFRQPDLYDESPGSSDYSTGSTLLLHSAANKLEQAHAEICSLHQDTGTGSESIHIEGQKDVGECEMGLFLVQLQSKGFSCVVMNNQTMMELFVSHQVQTLVPLFK